MPKAFLVVAAVVTLAVLISGEGFAEKICGTVFWDVSEDSVGAIGVLVYAQREGEAQPHMTLTNCCGEYAFADIDSSCHDVWAVYSYQIYPLCPVTGSECDTFIETDTQTDICPDAINVNFDLGIDCTNDEKPCDDPCPN